MLNYKQLSTVLNMQSQLNDQLNKDWRAQDFNWTRAIMVESVEAIEHHGWKWWKKQTPNMAEFKLELVDIFHFALSYELNVEGVSNTEIYDHYVDNCEDDFVSLGRINYYFTRLELLEMMDLMVALAGMKRFSFALFNAILNRIDFTWVDLYKLYLAKNVLNKFRNDNGYKTGEYVKIWNGKEDNEVLTQLLTEIDSEEEDFAQILYEELKECYSKRA